MAGTTTKRSVSSKPSSKAAPAAPKEDPRVKALEAKVAELEASLASLAKSLEQLASAPAQAPASSGGRDEELRSELSKYFKTLQNSKSRTHIPHLD